MDNQIYSMRFPAIGDQSDSESLWVFGFRSTTAVLALYLAATLAQRLLSWIKLGAAVATI
jgi:hypothetical protein